jgi:hypothetical protein
MFFGDIIESNDNQDNVNKEVSVLISNSSLNSLLPQDSIANAPLNDHGMYDYYTSNIAGHSDAHYTI